MCPPTRIGLAEPSLGLKLFVILIPPTTNEALAVLLAGAQSVSSLDTVAWLVIIFAAFEGIVQVMRNVGGEPAFGGSDGISQRWVAGVYVPTDAV